MVQIDLVQLLVQLCAITILVLAIKGMIDKAGRMRQARRGTYGNGLPERRRRPRIVLPDPATLAPRTGATGEII